MGGLSGGINTNALVPTLSAPHVLKPLTFWADQIVTQGYAIDASRFVTPVPLQAGLSAAQLVPYAQDAGMALLNAAVQALVQEIQSGLSTNQYYRGGIVVWFPSGIIPLAQTHIMSAGRTTYRGAGHGTVFAKVGGDYGDMLHFQDSVTINNVYCKGNTGLRDFAVIDLTATSHGGLIICDTFEFGEIVNLRLHNGYENLVVMGCDNTKFDRLVSRSDGDLGGGGSTGSSGKFLSGSSFVASRTAYNGDIEFFNCTIAGGDPSHRYTHDAYNIEIADVLTIIGGEVGCIARADIHLQATGSQAIQAVKARGVNLDNACEVNFLADGSGTGTFGSDCDFDVHCFGPDKNFVNIASPSFSGARFHLTGFGAPREAIVCQGSSCQFSGKLRGVGTGATANGQYSAIWLGGGSVNSVRNMDIEGSATCSLAYGVELTLGGYGNSVQSSTVVPGGSALGGTSYDDGTFDTTGLVVVGGAPKSPASSSAARTTPTVITS